MNPTSGSYSGSYRRFGALSSSVDPTQLSLTISSVGKVLAGFLAFLAAAKGLDPAVAQNESQLIIDMIAQGIPLAYSLWNSCNAIWGAARKLLVYFTAPQ